MIVNTSCKGSIYVLNVTDDAMISDRIYPGDRALIDTEAPFSERDIVAIEVEGKVLLRRIKQVNERWMIVSQNNNSLEKLVDITNIYGKVIQVSFKI